MLRLCDLKALWGTFILVSQYTVMCPVYAFLKSEIIFFIFYFTTENALIS